MDNRRLPRATSCVDISSGGDKGIGGARLVGLSSEVECGPTVQVSVVNVGPVIQKGIDHLGMSVSYGQVKYRGKLVDCTTAAISSCGQKRSCTGDVAFLTYHHQRRETSLVDDIEIGTRSGQQRCHDVFVAQLSSKMKRSTAPSVQSIRTSPAD